MTAAQLKALFQTNIGAKTAAGSIYPLNVTDCLDAIVDSIVAGDIGGGGGGGTAPTITSKSVANGTPSVIDVVFDQSMTSVTTAGFSAKKNGSAWAVSSVTGAGTNWSFTMATSAINGDTILMSYDSTTGATVGTTLELVTFTDSSVTNNVGASYDTDAQAFFTATGITDTTQKNAVNTLVLALKSASIWTKMLAVYPFVGGTSTTHKFNLKDPRDLDAAFRITFNGTITHSANGIAGGGTIADYGNTHIIPSSVFTGNSGAYGVYLRTAGSGTVTYFGTVGASTSVSMSNASGTLYCTLGETISGAAPMSANPAAFTRFLMLSRTGTLTTDSQGYRDGTNFGNSGNAFVSYPGTYEMFLCARNLAGTVDTATNASIAFAFVSSGLNSTEAGQLRTAVDAFELALTRNV